MTPAYNLAAKYDPRFNGEYQLDNATGIATLTAPTPALKDFKLQMKPMLGCISVAPPGFEAFTGPHLGATPEVRWQRFRCIAKHVGSSWQ